MSDVCKPKENRLVRFNLQPLEFHSRLTKSRSFGQPCTRESTDANFEIARVLTLDAMIDIHH